MKIFLPTYIELPPSLLLSLLSLCSLLPVCAYVSLLTLTISQRSLRTLSPLLGKFFVHALTSVLKRLVAHPRPPPLPGALHPLTDTGMPSNHSAQSAFLASYTLSMLLFLHPRRHRLPAWERVAAVVAAAIYPCFVACSRIVVGAHTMTQVAVGGTLGLWVGIPWAVGQEWLLKTSAAKAILRGTIARGLGVDVVSENDVLVGGSENGKANGKRAD